MIIEIPNGNSIVKWKYKETDEWKSAEISELIKAYERPTGDLISREALKEQAIWTKVNNGVELIDIDVVPLDAIDNAQAVDERKKGEWIKCEYLEYKCSVCGRHITLESHWTNVTKDYPFCHCGADMRGGAE